MTRVTKAAIAVGLIAATTVAAMGIYTLWQLYFWFSRITGVHVDL